MLRKIKNNLLLWHILRDRNCISRWMELYFAVVAVILVAEKEGMAAAEVAAIVVVEVVAVAGFVHVVAVVVEMVGVEHSSPQG